MINLEFYRNTKPQAGATLGSQWWVKTQGNAGPGYTWDSTKLCKLKAHKFSLSFPRGNLRKVCHIGGAKLESLLQSVAEEVSKLSLPLVWTDTEKIIGGSVGIETSINAPDFFGH